MTSNGILLDHFNPRSPCGERPEHLRACPLVQAISIHAPRVGSDKHRILRTTFPTDFNPRSPCGERLYRFYPRKAPKRISIHAPRVGSDQPLGPNSTGPDDFNPRSPCGERPPSSTMGVMALRFQSTLPVWGATWAQFRRVLQGVISIHAPRVGSDLQLLPGGHPGIDFNPRSPCGERPRRRRCGECRRYFNPRSPCGERRQAGAQGAC